MKVSRKILDKIIKEEVEKLISEQGSIPRGAVTVGTRQMQQATGRELARQAQKRALGLARKKTMDASVHGLGKAAVGAYGKTAGSNVAKGVITQAAKEAAEKAAKEAIKKGVVKSIPEVAAVMVRASGKQAIEKAVVARTTQALTSGAGKRAVMVLSQQGAKQAAKAVARVSLKRVLAATLGPIGAAWLAYDLYKLGVMYMNRKDPISWWTGGISKGISPVSRQKYLRKRDKAGVYGVEDWDNWPEKTKRGFCADASANYQKGKIGRESYKRCQEEYPAYFQDDQGPPTATQSNPLSLADMENFKVNENKMILENHRKNRKVHPAAEGQWWYDA